MRSKLKETSYHLYGESWSWCNWYWFHGNITMYIDYSKFERFSNVADEVSAKLLLSFLEYEVLVVVTDQCDFEFSIKAADRNCWSEDSAHIQEIEIIDNRNVHSHFKVTSGIRTIKTSWWNHVEIRFPKNRMKDCHTFYLSNLDGEADSVTIQSSERIDFYCDHEEADTKMFVYIKFLCDNICLNRIIIVSSDTDVTVISWRYCTFVSPLGLGLGRRLALSRVSSWWVINNKGRGVRKCNSADIFILKCH